MPITPTSAYLAANSGGGTAWTLATTDVAYVAADSKVAAVSLAPEEYSKTLLCTQLKGVAGNSCCFSSGTVLFGAGVRIKLSSDQADTLITECGLYYNGVLISNNKESVGEGGPTAIPQGALAYMTTWGGANDNWDMSAITPESYSPTVWGSPLFGVGIRITNPSTENAAAVTVDHVELTWYYHDPGGTEVGGKVRTRRGYRLKRYMR